MHGLENRLADFEAFTLDLVYRSLRADNRDIDLRPKSLDVLCYLVENSDRLVSKDEIVAAVWPNVVVTDEFGRTLHQ